MALGTISAMAAIRMSKGVTRRTFSSLCGVLLITIIVCFHALRAIPSSDSPGNSFPRTQSPKAYRDTYTQLSIQEPTPDTKLEDVVLVIKTGATESLRKLPVHFHITLQRWPHVLLLSDFSEEVEGHGVHDALDIISEEIRESSTSFELWRRLRNQGRSALTTSDPESSDQIQWLATHASDRQEGWRLARFMNLPMAVKAREYKPDAKWYVFIDADTFVSWSNTIRLLEQLDYQKPLYLGSQVAMGPGEFFAHGGSGYVLSRTALQNVTDLYQSRQEHWDRVAEEGDYGEVPLARALLEAGIPLTWANPHFQGGQAREMDFGFVEHGRKVCFYPAITYHHMSNEEISSLSDFEDVWNTGRNSARPFRHSDLFKQWVLPAIQENDGLDWDNVSDTLIEGIMDESECRAACINDGSCFQYSFREDQCRIDTGHPKIGRSRQGSKAGWVKERIDKYVHDLDTSCGQFLV